MKKTVRKKRHVNSASKQLFAIVLFIGLIMIGIACFFRFGPLNKPGTIQTDISSQLRDAAGIAELSTAEFNYRGIADIYSDEGRTRANGRVCYNANVKAGINMNNVEFIVDSENKVIFATLPDIELNVTIDEKTMALLPSNADVGKDSMLRYSREDAENEAKESSELINTAKENLKAAIEGLCFPILKSQGYSLVWN